MTAWIPIVAAGIPLFPPEASSVAWHVDRLFFGLCAFSIVVVGIVFFGNLYFAIRYRNGSNADRSHQIHNSTPIEVTWTVITALVFGVFFVWGLQPYFEDFRPPEDAMQILVVGRQWMWKVEHPDGRREINQLHVPVGQSVELNLTSEDVIHSFGVPAFRVKRDVLPGRYETVWFRPTVPGVYHLFCDQFCGAFHANMIGQIVVMEGSKYQEWLSEVRDSTPMVREGEELFRRHGCVACHTPGGKGPELSGLPGRLVHLSDGSVIVADDNYIRDSILAPGTQVVAGYPNIMPTFQGQLSETQLAELIAYIKSLGIEEQEVRPQ